MLYALLAANIVLALLAVAYVLRLVPRWRRAWDPLNAVSALVIVVCVVVVSQRYWGSQQTTEQALEFYHAALDAQVRGDLQEAEKKLRESLALRPHQPEAQSKLEELQEDQEVEQRRVQAPTSVDPSATAGASVSPRRSSPPKPPPPPEPRAQEPSPFGIRRYDLTVDLNPAEHTLVAVAEIRIQARQDIDQELAFSLNPEFVPSRVFVDGQPAKFRHPNDRLSITLPKRLRKDQQALVKVEYARESASPMVAGGDLISDEGTFLRTEARWYPGTGELDFRAPVRVTVKVPKGLSVVSVGALKSLTKTEDTSTFVWATERPAAMIALAVNRYTLQSEYVGDLKITAYTTQKRRPGGKRMLKEAASIVRYYSRLFGPYPFEKLAIVEIPRFPGGYGTTSFVMLIDASFEVEGSPDELREFLAHEIAHQWWGNSVFPQGLGAAWLSEAFANYSAWMYLADSAGNQNVLRKRVRAAVAAYVSGAATEGDQAIREADPYQPMGAHQAIIYEKGAVILHTLRGEMGDKAFLQTLRRFADEHRYGKAAIEDFQKLAGSVHGQSLDWFFDQWLGRTGRMEFTYHFDNIPLTPTTQRVTLYIDQKLPVYRASLAVDLQVGNQVQRERVELTQARQQISFTVPKAVTAVNFDPESWLMVRAQWVVPDEPGGAQ